jgi:hypothetical protein
VWIGIYFPDRGESIALGITASIPCIWMGSLVTFRTTVNPSLETAGKTSVFCTLRRMTRESVQSMAVETFSSPVCRASAYDSAWPPCKFAACDFTPRSMARRAHLVVWRDHRDCRAPNTRFKKGAD